MRHESMMRSHSQEKAFFGGIVAGLAVAGVAFVTVTRALRARSPRPDTERANFIDGVHPPSIAELDARPTEETNGRSRLASEAVDMSPMSQRW